MPPSARLLGNSPTVNGWRLLRIDWPPETAGLLPGQWLRIGLEAAEVPATAFRAASDGWQGLLAAPPADTLLAAVRPHSAVTVSGPYGATLPMQALRPGPVLLASDAGIPAILFLAERLPTPPRLVLLGGRQAPPFRAGPSQFLLSGLPAAVTAAAPMLETQGIASRIATEEERPGCYEGSVVDLLRIWLASQPQQGLDLLTCVSAAETRELEDVAHAGGHRLHILEQPPLL